MSWWYNSHSLWSEQWCRKCSVYAFWFDARSSSADIKGTVVGMVSSPCSASVLVEVTALLVFVTPERTLFVLTVSWVLCMCVSKKAFWAKLLSWLCAYSAAVHSRGNSVGIWPQPHIHYTHRNTLCLWLSGGLTWSAGRLAECRAAAGL